MMPGRTRSTASPNHQRYSYSGKNVGIGTVVATAGSVSARATKAWYHTVRPAKLDISPSIGHNASGERHTIVATVWGSDGKPMAGVKVNFSVSRVNSFSGSAITDSNGRAFFGYNSKRENKNTFAATVTASVPPSLNGGKSSGNFYQQG